MAGNVIEVILRARDDASRAVQTFRGQLGQIGKDAALASGGSNQFTAALAGIAPAAGIAAIGVGALAIGAAKATESFVGLVNEAAKRGDEFSKLSKQTGISAENLSRFQFAAEQNETSLAALAQGTRILSRNMFDAARGSGDANVAFKALGISQKDLKSGLGGTSEAILTIAERLSKVQDPGTRTALALKIFGRSAAELVPLLSQGRGGIEQFMKQADALGITVSSTAAKLSDDYSDALQKVTRQFDGIKLKIAEQALPAFIRFAEVASESISKVANTIERNRGAFEAFANLIGRSGELALRVTVQGMDLAEKLGKIVRGLMDVPVINIAVRFVPQALLGPGGGEGFRLIEDLAKPEKAAFGDRDRDLNRRTEKKGSGIVDIGEDAKKARAEAEKLKEAIRQLFVQLALAPELAIRDAGKAERAKIEERIGELRLKLGIEIDPRKVEDLKDQIEELQRQSALANGLQHTPGSQGRLITGDDVSAKVEAIDLSPVLGQAEALREQFAFMGVDIDAVSERLITLGADFEDAIAVAVVANETLAQSFTEAFDPFANAVSDTRSAVGAFKSEFDGAFTTVFDDIFVKGKNVFDALGKFILNVMLAIRKLVLDIAAAIAKALILKALGFGLGLPFSSGGSVVNSIGSAATGGTIQPARMAQGGAVSPVFRIIEAPRMSSGGAIVPGPRIFDLPRMAAGGAVASLGRAAMFAGAIGLAAGGAVFSTSSPVHAAGGLGIVPGNPQAYDRIPAVLAPGEVVLPTVGGQSPAGAVVSMVRLEEDFRRTILPAITRSESQRGSNTTVFNVQTIDADGFRGFVRAGGLRRETALAEHPGRD